MIVLLAVFLLTGCRQTCARDYEGVVFGVAQINSQNASAKEKAELAAEANACYLLEFCQGCDFLIKTKSNGAVSAAVETASEMSGLSATRIQGANGYAFVRYDMPKEVLIPERYKKNKPEMVVMEGKAENDIHLILDKVTQRGAEMLKQKGLSQGNLYVQARRAVFNIKDSPPTFRLELFMWFTN